MAKKKAPIDHAGLKEFREETGLSQRELSLLSGVSQSTISKFESGLHSIDFEVYFMILEALDISVYYEFPLPRVG